MKPLDESTYCPPILVDQVYTQAMFLFWLNNERDQWGRAEAIELISGSTAPPQDQPTHCLCWQLAKLPDWSPKAFCSWPSISFLNPVSHWLDPFQKAFANEIWPLFLDPIIIFSAPTANGSISFCENSTLSSQLSYPCKFCAWHIFAQCTTIQNICVSYPIHNCFYWKFSRF